MRTARLGKVSSHRNLNGVGLNNTVPLRHSKTGRVPGLFSALAPYIMEFVLSQTQQNQLSSIQNPQCLTYRAPSVVSLEAFVYFFFCLLSLFPCLNMIFATFCVHLGQGTGLGHETLGQPRSNAFSKARPTLSYCRRGNERSRGPSYNETQQFYSLLASFGFWMRTETSKSGPN